MPTFTIRFRGVGVHVANAQPGFVTEVLFPRADEKPPNGTDDGIFENQAPDADHPGPWKKRKMTHADKSVANEHFAGALLVGTWPPKHFDLMSARVRRKETDGTGFGASIDKAFHEDIAPLDKIIKGSPITLLADHEDVQRVATRFLIEGDSFDTAEFSGQHWIFKGKRGERPPQDYRLEVVWTIEADELEFDIYNLNAKATDRPRETIKLDATRNELYVYNFDIKNPKKDKLKERHEAKIGTVDHDFKWIYKLFDKKENTWQKWLAGEWFPAPEAFDTRRATKKPDDTRTVSVSTCFQTGWTGGDSRK